MNKLIAVAFVSMLAANMALAQSAAPAANKAAEAKPAAAAPAKVEEKKADPAKGGATCADQATEKKLAGAAKSSFMKKCEKEGGSKGDAKAGAKTTQQEKMKNCNKEAGEKKLKGAERKEFMSGCLKNKA